MNYCTAQCGHNVIAIGAPGSTARKRCERLPCDECKPATGTFKANGRTHKAITYMANGMRLEQWLPSGIYYRTATVPVRERPNDAEQKPAQELTDYDGNKWYVFGV